MKIEGVVTAMISEYPFNENIILMIHFKCYEIDLIKFEKKNIVIEQHRWLKSLYTYIFSFDLYSSDRWMFQ